MSLLTSTKPTLRLTLTATLAAVARSMSSSPVKFYALRYTYVDGMLEKRQPYRQAHLDGLKKMADLGKCVLGGAFNDPCDGAVVLFDSSTTTKEEIEAFANVDPYVVNNLVPSWSVSEYMAVVGSLKPDS
mmetsp:Transcript_991/g.1412  ORF Transcript_991/g.1412 Transcript_991/m.1412 type:complete len:130 (+) Transcript_991:2682-3071(+)